MNLSTKQKIAVIEKLTHEIYQFNSPSYTLLFLEEYTKQKKVDLCHFSHDEIMSFIKKLDSSILMEMYKDLFPKEAKKVEIGHKYHLSTDKLVLFFSHSHKNVKLVSSVKKNLEQTEWIECFVAHKDIEPAKDWEEEIKKYLECCHCVVPFLSKDFKQSKYCDQEVGFAVKRNIPIFPIRLDNTDPYGFIKHIQAVTAPKKSVDLLANQIEIFIFDKERSNLFRTAQPKIEKIIGALKNNFLNSTNVKMAESVLEQLEKFKKGQIPESYIDEIYAHWKQNKKINEVRNIEEKMGDFFQKHQKTIKNEADSKTTEDSLKNQVISNLKETTKTKEITL